MATELQRDHKGNLHVVVNGTPVHGAIVTGLEVINGVGQCLAVYIPLRDVTFGEVKNVIPFPAAYR